MNAEVRFESRSARSLKRINECKREVILNGCSAVLCILLCVLSITIVIPNWIFLSIVILIGILGTAFGIKFVSSMSNLRFIYLESEIENKIYWDRIKSNLEKD